MEIKKVNINGREVEFVNEARNTRNGFAHDTTFFVDGYQRGKATCHYINRTWEAYRFQTVMLNAVYTLIDEVKEQVKAQFMAEKGYARLTANRRTELEAVFAENEEIKFYEAVRANILRR